MKTVINPLYSHLEQQLLEIVNGNYTPDIVYCNKRNKVEKVTIAGEEFVVKSFKRAPFVNRFVYRFFRKSKARRAYEYALQLLDRGIDTPFPVAYFEIYSNGLFERGVFISKFVPYSLLDNLYSEVDSDSERQVVISCFIDFLCDMHKKGVVSMDMNAANLFYHKDEATGRYNFALTDINRMVFGVKPAPADVYLSLEQCFYPIERLCNLVRLYCEKRGADVDEFEIMYSVLAVRVKRRRRFFLKRKMERFLGIKK